MSETVSSWARRVEASRRRAGLPLSQLAQRAGVGRDRLTVALHGLNEGEVSRLMQVIEALDA